MAAEPITHRVTPRVADAWIANAARPPGDGFEKIERAAQIRRWVDWAVWTVAVLAIVVAVVVAFGS